MSVIKRIILSSLAPALLSKTGAHKLFAGHFGGIGHILMLHRVLPEKLMSEIASNRYTEVTPEFLEKAVNLYLDSGFKIVSMDKVIERLESDNPKQSKFVAFTFDDGYKDNINYALPVFEKYNCPFTVYPVSGFIDRQVLPWWILADEALKTGKPSEIKLFDGAKSFTWSGSGNKELFMDEIHKTIVSSDIPLLNNQNPMIISNISVEDIFEQNFLTAEELKELSGHPLVTIGAHSVTHRAFNKLKDLDIIDEINYSVKYLSEIIGKQVNHFCYPYGSRAKVDSRVLEIAAKTSLKSAVTTRQASIFREHIFYPTSLPRYHFTMQLSKYGDFTKLFSSGSVQAIANKFKKVVTN